MTNEFTERSGIVSNEELENVVGGTGAASADTDSGEGMMSAIKVDPQDTCIFWAPMDGSTVMLQQCKYCLYGKFGDEDGNVWKYGLCKRDPR